MFSTVYANLQDCVFSCDCTISDHQLAAQLTYIYKSTKCACGSYRTSDTKAVLSIRSPAALVIFLLPLFPFSSLKDGWKLPLRLSYCSRDLSHLKFKSPTRAMTFKSID